MIYVLQFLENDQDQVVLPEHFGVNLVTIYDEEFVDYDNSLAVNVQNLNTNTLRFPGGAATEYYFDMMYPDNEISFFDGSQSLTPMDKFFQRAGEIGVNVSLVVPTREAFTNTAAEALLSGAYGNRSQIDEDYLLAVTSYVSNAISYAKQNGVTITALEIGNEFWGSGEMSASEYGSVAGNLAVLLNNVIEEFLEYSPEIIVQTTSAASQIFSPKESVLAYVGSLGGELLVLSQSDVPRTADGTILEGWTLVEIPAAGTAVQQVEAIAENIKSVSGASSYVDGIAQHYYEQNGFDAVDEAKQFKFAQFQRLEGFLGLPDGSLSYHITEWNTNTYGAHARGLQNASMIVEVFYELVINGVDVAQIWPLSFNRAQGISLVSQDSGNLSISGEMFRLMSESLVGLSPTLDWDVAGEIDIHGFSSETKVVLFASERSGNLKSETTFSLDKLFEGRQVFLTAAELWDGGAGGADASAKPMISYDDGYITGASDVQINLNSWAIRRIEITFVGDQADIILGRSGDDQIHGYGGNDLIKGGAGNDYLEGGSGNDTIIGGTGSDQFFGGDGHDIAELHGDNIFASFVLDGDDLVFFQASNSNGEIDELHSIETVLAGERSIDVGRLFNYARHLSDHGSANSGISLADFLASPAAGLPVLSPSAFNETAEWEDSF